MSDQQLTEAIVRLLAEGRITADAADELLSRPSQAQSDNQDRIAVLGSSVRLPGMDTPHDMWQALTDRRDTVSPFPSQRFDLVVNSNDTLRREFKALRGSGLHTGSWLTGIEQFDPEAFSLTAFEAELMGPAERLVLMTATEALIASGLDPQALRGSRTGIFLAYQPDRGFDYLRMFDDPDDRTFLSGIPANVGYRVAYTHDFHGPVMNVDTTCSSSLSAVHLARRSLAAGDCDIAIVAGVSLNLFPFEDPSSDHFVKSPRNRCNAYDTKADGIVWSEGVVSVVLRRLTDAVAQDNVISATLAGSAMANDGVSNGMAAPNPDAHYAVVRAALADAGLTAEDIGYVEGHGAGTRLGDLVEIDALTRAFRDDSDRIGFCDLGSFKTVVGHLGDAAGVAGLLAASLRLQHSARPGLAGLEQPNGAVDWDTSPFRLHTETEPWMGRDGAPRRAGVSSLGLSGTNVHVVLEEYAPATARDEGPLPVWISAPTRWAIWEYIRRLGEGLDDEIELADVAHTLNRRAPGDSRVVVVATGPSDLRAKLARLLEVRAFDRVPAHFADQGIFIADTDESRDDLIRQLDTGDVAGPRPKSETLWKATEAFLAGRAVDADAVAPRGRSVVLPVAPFTTRRIWPSNTSAGVVDVADLFYSADWRPVEPVAAADNPSKGLVLVLAATTGGVGESLCRELRMRGAEVVTATAGPRFARVSDEEFTFDPDSEHDLLSLWNELGEERTSQLVAIVHTLACAPSGLSSLEAIGMGQRNGALSLFRAARAVSRLDADRPIDFVVVTGPAHAIFHTESYDPGRATAFGFARVFSQENSHIRELSIDHDGADGPDQVAQHVVAELFAPAEARLPLVAYREGLRHAKVVEHLEQGGGTALRVRPGGTYVIAGGTGYLGPQVARFLGERGANDVVLLSRSGMPSDQNDSRVAAVRWAEESGVRVHSVRADVTDAGEMAEAFSWIRREVGNPDGGLMLTKELFHKWISALEFSEFEAGLRNRLHGTYLLANELRRDAADFLVLFSSISSMSGTKGAAECAGANQFLDAVGPLLTDSGIPTYTLNLTLVLDDKAEFAAKTPIPPIDFAEFHTSLSRFFGDAHGLDVVARFDLNEVHYLRPVLRIPLSDQIWAEADQAVRVAQGEVPETPAGLNPEQTPDDIRRLLEKAWADTLGTTPNDATNFFTAGGTSLSAIRLIHLIRKSLPALEFDVTRLYSLPRFSDQVEFLTRPEESIADEQVDSLDAIMERVARGELVGELAADLLLSGTSDGADR